MKKLLAIQLAIQIVSSAFSFQLKGQVINTFAGTGAQGFFGDGGPAVSAQLNHPGSIAVDAFCNVYFTDRANHRVRKINGSGIITTIAGTGANGYSGDGGPATSATFQWPENLTLDAAGNIYVCDSWNYCVRKINTSGIISTIAGNGIGGFSGDGGPAVNANLGRPRGIAIDASNNIFICDYDYDRIRKIDPSGIITTFAGTTSGYSGDGGPASLAQMRGPTGITIDASGNLYFAQQYWQPAVRKINTTGIISTVAGNGQLGYSGDGGLATAAELMFPADVAVDLAGNLYIADERNHVIRIVNTSGIINTFAGTGTAGFSGDGGQAIAAEFNRPSGIKIDQAGNFYIPDSLNNRIRIIGSNFCLTGINGQEQKSLNLTAHPNPSKGTFQLQMNDEGQNTNFIVTNSLGQKVHEQQISKGTNTVIIQNILPGLYNYILYCDKSKAKYGKLAIE